MKFMKRLLALIFWGMTSIFLGQIAHAQRQMAITIDDPNTKDTPLLSSEERNDRILRALRKHKIQAALFVCGMRVNDDPGRELLATWDKKGHLICNHSYSHWYFNAKSRSAASFIQDFQRGDSLIRGYQNYTPLFRFPYLKEGNTAAKRDSMRTALVQTQYRNGFVTIDASDWYVDAKVTEALKENPDADLTPYKQYYIRHILDRAKYYDDLATNVFGRKIKHTLLIHHSLLNALFLDDLLDAMEADKWELIDAKAAYGDSVYSLQPEIEPCGESLAWQCAKLDSTLAQTLRYPAEDSEYEEAPLREFLEAYRKRGK